MFPVGYRTDLDVEAATYRYAAVEQAPLYVGAPMLSALLPAFATRAGERGLARRLLDRGYADFINEPFLEPDEYPRSRTDRPRASPMFANLSGYLTSLLYGFTGSSSVLASRTPGPFGGCPSRRLASHRRGARLDRAAARDSLEARHGRATRLVAAG